jgi:hypothetical protein
MLRSAATPNRTEVQSNPEMKQTTIRRILSTPTASVRSACALAMPHNPAEINFRRSLV